MLKSLSAVRLFTMGPKRLSILVTTISEEKSGMRPSSVRFFSLSGQEQLNRAVNVYRFNFAENVFINSFGNHIAWANPIRLLPLQEGIEKTD